MADGEAAPEDVLAVRPHLRGCPACRATLRDFHAAPVKLAALLPAGALVAPATALATGRTRMPGLGGVVARLHEAAVGATPAKVSAVVDASSAGKVAAVAASTVAIAGGGIAAVDSNVRRAVLRQHQAPPAKIVRVTDRHPRPKVPAPVAGATRPVVDRSVAKLSPTTTTAAAPVHHTAAPAKPKPSTPQEFTARSTTSSTASSSAPQEFTAAPAPAPSRPAATASSGPAGGSSSAPNEFGP
jgi:hypothetical protein